MLFLVSHMATLLKSSLCKAYYLDRIKKDLLELEAHSVLGFILISGLFAS